MDLALSFYGYARVDSAGHFGSCLGMSRI